MDHENAPRGSRFVVGAVIGAVVGGLVAGLIVVSLGDPQRIYVTEKVDTAEALGRAVADVLDNQAPATTVALDAETVSDGATTPEVEKTDAGRLDVKAVLAAVAPTVVQI